MAFQTSPSSPSRGILNCLPPSARLQHTMASQASPSGPSLGLLGRLPYEIRAMIYTFAVSDPAVVITPASPSFPAMMRTSFAIRDEFSAVLYAETAMTVQLPEQLLRLTLFFAKIQNTAGDISRLYKHGPRNYVIELGYKPLSYQQIVRGNAYYRKVNLAASLDQWTTVFSKIPLPTAGSLTYDFRAWEVEDEFQVPTDISSGLGRFFRRLALRAHIQTRSLKMYVAVRDCQSAHLRRGVPVKQIQPLKDQGYRALVLMVCHLDEAMRKWGELSQPLV
ncbi:hypothetical protein BDV95DRAFT_130171 [Massariosphaeria phaeospora]|uniref:F-box domain-containing protein n=1 Tax=Massariosphaeria phaeospora TaxID=100035 RepID=A0A7C8MAW1_9PLEO|nr:hypothetical protein BDV95DRAFT_130171 [Massariosphaeria phaeospora]